MRPYIRRNRPRVGVFIDVQNLYYAARQFDGRRVDYAALLEAAVRGRHLAKALAYVVEANGNEGPFFALLNHLGIETRVKQLQRFADGNMKGNWDVGMAVDAIRYSFSEKLDVISLVSGDGDFVELVEYLKGCGRRVEVLAFRQATSGALIEAADSYLDLGGGHGRFLLPARPSSPIVRPPGSQDK